MKNSIGIYDSGIGGLTILEKVKEIMPNENILFYQDSKNNPYGNKTDKELLAINENIINYLLKNECKIIVIACNTATTRCVSKLRKEYPQTIIVGTEPAIKPACNNNHKNILVLGTEATISSKKLINLIKEYQKNNQNIFLQSCPGLANAIETNNEEEINKLLKEYLGKYSNVDAVVLGCTHYAYVSDLIKKHYIGVTIYDEISGVSNEVKRQLELHNLINNQKQRGIITIKKEQ